MILKERQAVVPSHISEQNQKEFEWEHTVVGKGAVSGVFGLPSNEGSDIRRGHAGYGVHGGCRAALDVLRTCV